MHVLILGGGSCNFQPCFRGGSVIFVPKRGGGPCVFHQPHFRPNPPPPLPPIHFDQSLNEVEFVVIESEGHGFAKSRPAAHGPPRPGGPKS